MNTTLQVLDVVDGEKYIVEVHTSSAMTNLHDGIARLNDLEEYERYIIFGVNSPWGVNELLGFLECDEDDRCDYSFDGEEDEE